MDFEQARIRKAVYDFIPKRQKLTRLQPFIVEGAKAREAGVDRKGYPYLDHQRQKWWKYGWDLMDRALNPNT